MQHAMDLGRKRQAGVRCPCCRPVSRLALADARSPGPRLPRVTSTAACEGSQSTSCEMRGDARPVGVSCARGRESCIILHAAAP